MSLCIKKTKINNIPNVDRLKEYYNEMYGTCTL